MPFPLGTFFFQKIINKLVNLQKLPEQISANLVVSPNTLHLIKSMVSRIPPSTLMKQQGIEACQWKFLVLDCQLSPPQWIFIAG